MFRNQDLFEAVIGRSLGRILKRYRSSWMTSRPLQEKPLAKFSATFDSCFRHSFWRRCRRTALRAELKQLKGADRLTDRCRYPQHNYWVPRIFQGGSFDFQLAGRVFLLRSSDWRTLIASSPFRSGIKVTAIPVVDLFAGPGGLGEGFATLHDRDDRSCFRVRLSIEKDFHAHQTLLLRAFYRQFSAGRVPRLVP